MTERPETAIRQAEPDDVETLVDLRDAMIREMGITDEPQLLSLREVSIPWVRKAMAEDRAFGWIAEEDGTVVGGVSLTFVETQPQLRAQQGRLAYLYGLYVSPSHRRAGIATALVSTAVDHARSNGVELLTLHAADRARPIYQRLGFEPSGEMRLLLSPDAARPERRASRW